MGKYFDKDGVTEISEAECNIRKAAGRLFGNRNGDRYQFSDAREAIKMTDRGLKAINDPIKNWTAAMKKSDLKMMPRHMEDLITNNASLVIPAEMKKRYDDKIKVRGEKP